MPHISHKLEMYYFLAKENTQALTTLLHLSKVLPCFPHLPLDFSAPRTKKRTHPICELIFLGDTLQ